MDESVTAGLGPCECCGSLAWVTFAPADRELFPDVVLCDVGCLGPKTCPHAAVPTTLLLKLSKPERWASDIQSTWASFQPWEIEEWNKEKHQCKKASK